VQRVKYYLVFVTLTIFVLVALSKGFDKLQTHRNDSKVENMFFARPIVQFLGHIVGSSRMSVVSGKITAIKALPEPSTKKLLGSFLGLWNYYRNVSLPFSGTAAPLTKLTKKGKVGSTMFTDHQRTTFERLGLFKAIPVRRQRVRYRIKIV